MRAVLVMLGTVAMLVAVAAQPASAGKGTDIEQLIKRIGKYADDAYNPKPRGLCVCLDEGSFQSEVGVLIYSGQLGDSRVSLYCSVPLFNASGGRTGMGGCTIFEVLAK